MPPLNDHFASLEQKAPSVRTAKELARLLADLTRSLRDLIIEGLEDERERGWLHHWLAAFRETLLPELEEAQFADVFAQTLAYGLFAARVHIHPTKSFPGTWLRATCRRPIRSWANCSPGLLAWICRKRLAGHWTIS